MLKKIFTVLLITLTTYTFAQPTLTTDSVLQLSTCAGGTVVVPFTVTGGNYNFGNVFTAQLSDMFGQFSNPVNIGNITWFTSGVIFATIPQNTNFSFLYRIRVIASNPVDTGSASPNTVIITQSPLLNQITQVPPSNYICPGDTVTLFAVNPAVSYSWSTGDTTATIQVTQPGIYSVTTTDILTCVSTAYDTLWNSCTGVAENNYENNFIVFPNPVNEKINISFRDFLNEKIVVSIYNSVGELISKTNSIAYGNATAFDVSALHAGIYLIEITGSGFYNSQRFVKK